MLSQPDFDDVVLFDVPAEQAEVLSVRLSANRLTWLDKSDEDDLLVAAALRVEPEDLAGLLREVETWVGESDLRYLRFILDGREYMLWAAQAEAQAGRAW
jgi:hypothetical protein